MRNILRFDGPPGAYPGAPRRGTALRPPWTGEDRIRAACTSCGDCIAVCPEAILLRGPAGTPTLDFARGACTFCGACAAACPEDVFGDTRDAPWTLTAAIGADCLLDAGVSCRSCTDACDSGALVFDLRAGAVGRVRADPARCIGCGACAGVCPAGAIAITEPPRKEHTA